jgi:hypothetical protein
MDAGLLACALICYLTGAGIQTYAYPLLLQCLPDLWSDSRSINLY